MTFNVDECLADIWLQTVRLRQGEQFATGEGRRLWQMCADNVTCVREVTRTAGLTEENILHITYACCALLDEAVKSREVQEDASLVWYQSPLQTHYFNTLDAGEALYERMRGVLREPAPEPTVLICFHRVLMLGFLGGLSPDAPTRTALLNELTSHIPAFQFQESQPVLNTLPARSSLGLWLRDVRIRLMLGLFAVGLLWWGLDCWLDSLLVSFAA